MLLAIHVGVASMTAPSTPEDWDVLRAWKRGDGKAGDELVTRYFAVLTRFFSNKVRHEDVGDLVADTFLACTSSIARVEQRGSFKSLLFGIAQNKLLQHYRMQGKRRRESDDFELACVASVGPGPSSFAVRREEVRVLVRALRRLPLAMQTVVELSFFEGMDGPAIAELLGLPVNTVYTQLRRGRQRLADLVVELARKESDLAETTIGLETWALQIRAQLTDAE